MNEQQQTTQTTLIPGYGAWVKAQGILLIIAGASYSLSIIGAIVGVPIIFAGIKMIKSSEIASEIDVNASDKVKVEQLTVMGKELKDGIKIYLITVIAIFSLTILAFILLMVFGFLFMASNPEFAN
jgi:hypothetical protein